MLKWKANEGERMLSRTKVPGPPNSVPATPGDIIACLKANPEAKDAVITALVPADAVWYHTSEKARAEQAERSLATLRELIHTASGLDDHRYSAEQMVKEMAERWQGASDDCEKAEQALATVTAERDEALRVSEARRADLTLLRRLVMGGVGLLTTGEGKETWAAIRVLEEDRDALKAKLAEAERQRDAEVNAHDKLDDLAVAYARERDEARATASNYLERWNAEVERLRETLDTVIAREGSLKAKLAEAEREAHTAREESSIHYAILENHRARLAKLEAVVEAARELYEAAYLVDFTADPHRYSKLGSARILMHDRLRALDEDSPCAIVDSDTAAVGAVDSTPELHRLIPDGAGYAGSNPARSGSSGTPGPTGGAIPPAGATTPEPAGSSPDPLAALEGAVGRPLTAEDRERIQGVVARLRPEPPRGGLLPEPWERRTSDPEATATRAEVEELRRRIERLEKE